MPGCVTEGDTHEELAAMLRDAMEGWLGSMADMYVQDKDDPAELVEIEF